MAITTPRVLFACTIPTIIAILSFIWFKRKKEIENCNHHCSSSSSSSSSSSNSRHHLNYPVQACSPPNEPFYQYSKVEEVVKPDESVAASFEKQQQQEVEELEEEVVENLHINEMGIGTVTDQPDDPRQANEEKETKDTEAEYAVTEENVAQINDGSTSHGGNTEISTKGSPKCDEPYVKNTPSPAPLVDTAEKEIRLPDEHCPEESDSSTVSPKPTDVTEPLCETLAELLVSESEPAGHEALPAGEEEANASLETSVVECSSDAANSTAGTILLSSTSADDSTAGTVRLSSTSSSDDSRKCSLETAIEAIIADSNESTCESDQTTPTVENGTVVLSQSPEGVLPEVPVNGSSSAEEPELQKYGNGNSTSAYGSARHSPADDLLESPTASNYSDLHSEGSSDSGKGGSDIHTPSAESATTSSFPLAALQMYEFEIPQDLCGRLIGIRGSYVNLIKNKSRANISIKRHPFNPDFKLCCVVGAEDDLKTALELIRKRFPLSKFPYLNLLPVNASLPNGIPVPDTLQLHLPDGITCDVILSSLVTAGHFFVQQPTHPTYSSLSRLDQCMLSCYLNGMGAPELPTPVEPGIICAASTVVGWYRAQIVYVYSDCDDCELKFVDYGGYSRESVSSLRQIRSDFMTLPFQASECYLANVAPLDENQGWSLEATSYFEDLAQGQILQAQIVAYAEDGIPYVHLYRIQGVMSTFINKELVNCGLARWVEHQA